ncbi:MAG: helix-turn-helix transcriptional regulator [Verrucomicrobiota bacterium]
MIRKLFPSRLPALKQKIIFCKDKSSRIRYDTFANFCGVKRNLDKQLAKFLRKERGDLSYAQFAKKVGISHQTLFRIEHGEHRLTLDKLETVLVKLKMRLKNIFPDEF